MDPKACLESLIEALDNKHLPEAIELSGNLLKWLLSGGHIPNTTSREREELVLAFARLTDYAEDCLAAIPPGTVISGQLD